MKNVLQSPPTRKILTTGVIHRRPRGTAVDAECPRCGHDAVPVLVQLEPATFRGGVCETPDGSDATIADDCSSCGADDFTKPEKAMIIDHAWELFRGLAD